MKSVAAKSAREIDELLKKIKQKTGLTQEEIADKIGYNRSYISQAKKTDSDKLYKALYGHFRPMLENITHLKAKAPVNEETPPAEDNLSLMIRNNIKLTDAIYDAVQMLKRRDEQLDQIQASLNRLPNDMISLTSKVEASQQQILNLVAQLIPDNVHTRKTSQHAKS